MISKAVLTAKVGRESGLAGEESAEGPVCARLGDHGLPRR